MSLLIYVNPADICLLLRQVLGGWEKKKKKIEIWNDKGNLGMGRLEATHA